MAFEAFKDPNQRAALERERAVRLHTTPWSDFEFVDVTFTGAGNDVDIPHTLVVADPSTIRFLPINLSAGVSIYRDTTGTAKAWTATTIYLRATGAATARLLLFVER